MACSKLEDLIHALPDHLVETDPEKIAPWLTEWRDLYKGQTPLLLTPKTREDVALCVRECAARGIAIMPQGGNTGLVGGNTPQGEVLISLRGLKTIRAVDPISNTLIAEAGVTLLEAQEAAEKAGRKYPLSLASEGSCTVGGTLSTNAGGVHVIKYGTAKALCTGVEAVLANGEIYNGLSALKKDNTGYDLSRLFMGAEGTLGIITAASLKLFPKPKQLIRAMVALPKVEKGLELLSQLSGPSLTLFEIMPRWGIELVTRNIANMSDPFDEAYPWYGLLDFEFFDDDPKHQSRVENSLGQALEAVLIENAVIAKNESEAAALLALRENMSAAQKGEGASIKHDVSVPVASVADFIMRAGEACEAYMPGSRPLAFGHLGDGNIHYNLHRPKDMDSDEFQSHWSAVQNIVHDIVTDLGGSISAEHGIGIQKKDELSRRADPVKLALMRKVKSALDPDNIMNPRVML